MEPGQREGRRAGGWRGGPCRALQVPRPSAMSGWSCEWWRPRRACIPAPVQGGPAGALLVPLLWSLSGVGWEGVAVGRTRKPLLGKARSAPEPSFRRSGPGVPPLFCLLCWGGEVGAGSAPVYPCQGTTPPPELARWPHSRWPVPTQSQTSLGSHQGSIVMLPAVRPMLRRRWRWHQPRRGWDRVYFQWLCRQ